MAIRLTPKSLGPALLAGLALAAPGRLAAQVTDPRITAGGQPGTRNAEQAGLPGSVSSSGIDAARAGSGTTVQGIQSNSGMTRSRDGSRQPRETGTLRSPLETLADPSAGRAIQGLEVTPEQLRDLKARLLSEARSVANPGDRALAMERVAKAKLLAQDLSTARQALNEGEQAALLETSGTVRDRRIIGLVSTMMLLAEEQTRQGLPLQLAGRTDDVPVPDMAEDERQSWLSLSERSYNQAGALALRLTNVNFRDEMLARVAESQAGDSQRIITEIRNVGQAPTERMPGDDPLMKQADRELTHAVTHARSIRRPVWHDHALDGIVAKTAIAGQYDRGMTIATEITQPEIRTDAFLKLAEAAVRRGNQDHATRSYTEAARAVSRITRDDPRTTLAGVLIDSLISSGRFDDARRSIVLYPSEPKQLNALGAVAEAQGRRGLVDSALVWIDREAPSNQRALLRRRVTDGMLATVEQNRTQMQSAETPR